MDEFDGMDELMWSLLALEWHFFVSFLVLSRSHTSSQQFRATFKTITTSENFPLAGRDDLLVGRPMITRWVTEHTHWVTDPSCWATRSW